MAIAGAVVFTRDPHDREPSAEKVTADLNAKMNELRRDEQLASGIEKGAVEYRIPASKLIAIRRP